MHEASNKYYKQFPVNDATDACLVLGSLISAVTINLDKYREYFLEAEKLFENSDNEFVPAKEYDDINDKLLYRQRELLKYLADYQNSSFSYIDLRKLLRKKNLLTIDLDESTASILNELLEVSNWTFHNPQSMMVAAKEAAEKNIPEELKGMVTVTPQINPVIVQRVISYEIVVLGTLLMHAEKRIEQFEHILVCMKRDYQELFDSIDNKPLVLINGNNPLEVQYIEQNIVSKIGDYAGGIAQISMAIQKSKYDGTEDSFRDWVIRFNNDSNKDALE